MISEQDAFRLIVNAGLRCCARCGSKGNLYTIGGRDYCWEHFRIAARDERPKEDAGGE